MSFLRKMLVPRILGIVAAAAFGLWVFIEVAEEVLEGEAGAFDHAILLALRMPGNPAHSRGPAWLELAARDITALGSVTVLGLVVLAASVFLVLAKRHRTALSVLLSTTSGALATFLLKNAFGRPRPDLFPHGDYVVSASFPSGHAMISALVYLTLGALVAGVVASRTIKVYVLGVTLLLSGLIGVSRVYLGVHWPTDVLAGWAAGAAWALIWWSLVEAVKVKNGSGA